jgi:hypothetical protein
MKWAAIAVGVVVGLVVLIAIVGSLLPRDHVAAMSARVAAAPDAVWAALTDRAAFPTWRRDVKRIELLPDSSSGPSWREHAGHDAITYVAETQEPPRRLVSRIAGKNLPYGGSWEYRIEPDGASGSTVTVIERGSVYNPVFRFISRFFMGHTSMIDGFLRALSKKFGTEATPTAVAIGGEARGT